MFKSKSLKLLVFVLVGIFVLTLFGCSGSKKAEQPKAEQPKAEQPKAEQPKAEQPKADKSSWPKKLAFASGPIGGAAYTAASAWSGEVGAKVGVSISPETTGGNTVSIKMVNAKQAEIGIAGTDMVYEGWEGKVEWTGGQKMNNLRGVFILDPFVLQFYTTPKTGIKSIDDLNGKSINPSRAGSSTDVWVRRIVEALNIKPSKITNVAPADANQQLADGLLDVAAVQGGMPHPSASEFEATREMVVFGLGKERSQEFLKKYPYVSVVDIPAGTYKNQKEPVTSIASFQYVFVNKDLPADMVYELTKATYELKDKMASAAKALSYLDPKRITLATTPLHKGAAKYYEEVGVKLPANIAPID